MMTTWCFSTISPCNYAGSVTRKGAPAGRFCYSAHDEGKLGSRPAQEDSPVREPDGRPPGQGVPHRRPEAGAREREDLPGGRGRHRDVSDRLGQSADLEDGPRVGEEALAILEPGSYFGEMALIDDTPRSADATAHMPCTLYVIQKADLEELMFLHKDLAYELLWTFVRTLSARLRDTNDKIKAFFALSARF